MGRENKSRAKYIGILSLVSTKKKIESEGLLDRAMLSAVSGAIDPSREPKMSR